MHRKCHSKIITILKWKLNGTFGARIKNIFRIYFDLKPISKNKNQNFQIYYLIWNQKVNFRKFFPFSILKIKLKNEKWKNFKTRFAFKSRNELYFRYTNHFHFCFCFSFLLFLFLLSKSFCIIVNSTWPRGAIDGQLSLTCPRSVIAFSFANFPRGLAVPWMVNSLLIGLEMQKHLEIWHLA